MTAEEKAREEQAEKHVLSRLRQPTDNPNFSKNDIKAASLNGWDAHGAWAKAEASSSGEAGDEALADAKCPGDLNWRAECADGLYCGAKKSWKEGFLAGRASLREEMEAFRNEAADKIFRKDAENSQLRQEHMNQMIAAERSAQKEVGLLHEAIGQAEHREVNLRKALEDHKNHAHEVCLVWARDLEAKTRECEKMREALEDAEESLTSQHEEMVHFFENKCCPTEDEVVAAYNARQAAREALRTDSAKEGK